MSIITKNRKVNIAVTSVEANEALNEKTERYGLIKEGLNDVAKGKTCPLTDAISDIKAERQK